MGLFPDLTGIEDRIEAKIQEGIKPFMDELVALRQGVERLVELQELQQTGMSYKPRKRSA